jgi:aspartyl-tRNA(Asn)/glutamyl-tRNA(Gln) amidotransferase subunit B
MNFEAVVGLEIHVQMKTKSKMFSSSPNSFSHEPNTEITPFDMAYPGTMPVVNKQAVINAIRLANALHMEIDHTIVFDRKNYFYSDLPKGFQITQQFHPIGKNGYVDIETNLGKRQIRIERIHMEEDTCKQEHFMDYSLLDYNRAGVPLVEIVSLPDIRSGTEAMKYVEAIRNIVVYAGVSDGKMEEGSMRVDTNVSIRPIGEEKFGTKVEIKNINTLKNIEAAIDYECKRQSELLLSGKPVIQETRRYDEASGRTIAMRLKSDAVDYKYFCEPNITPITLSDEFVNDAIKSCPELYESKKARYLAKGLSDSDVAIILSDIHMSSYFEKALPTVKAAKDLANFLIVEINSYLNKKGLTIDKLPLKPETLGEIISMQEEGLTHKQASDILFKALDDGCSPKEAKEALHIVVQVSDSSAIMAFINEALSKNPQSIVDYKAGKDRALGFLVGQVMKLSHGKVNPAEVSKLLLNELKKR